jgi:hypothetical protein
MTKSENSIRVVCISDTHTKHEQITVPPGDVLIHAGDATIVGDVDETVTITPF